MLSEEKIAKVLELLQKSSLSSDKQKEWFIKLSDMKCEGQADECILELIEELLGEVDTLIETESEADNLRREIDELENQIGMLDDEIMDLEEDKETLESDIEDKDNEIGELRDEVSDLEAKISVNVLHLL